MNKKPWKDTLRKHLQTRRGKIILGGACALLVALIVVSGAVWWTVSDFGVQWRLERALRDNRPYDEDEFADADEIGKLADGEVYIPDDTVPMGEPLDFDLLSDDWWNKNVGYKAEDLLSDNTYNKSITIKTDGYVLEGVTMLKSSDADQFIIVDNADVTVREALLEGTVRVYTDRERGSVTVEHATFVMDKVRRFAIGGMGITARFNLISSLNDGITPTGGLTGENLIEYNWFKGPGYRVEDNHMDAIQLWREGNTTIRRNRFSGFDNSHIIVKSDQAPRYGDEPIKNVLITENFFEDQGPAWYYLFVCANATKVSEYCLTRPQYVTITNNCFESRKLHPIYTGLEKTESAMFVRTEEEREEGVRRQEEYPEVLELRQKLGWSKTAVDARTWIVWDGNYYLEDGSEVPPHDGKANKDWYTLEREREAFPLDAAAGLPEEFSVELIESSIGNNYLQWRLTNHTDAAISYEVIVPGDKTARQKRMEPGENQINTQRFPGENNLTIRWTDTAGEAREVLIEGFDYVVQDISASFVKAPNASYLDWEGHNPNLFTMKIAWSYDDSDETGNIWMAGEEQKSFRTPVGKGNLILTWLDEYGNQRSLTVPRDGTPGVVIGDDEGIATGDMITVEFIESSARTDYLNWTIVNHTSHDLTYYARLSGGNEKKLLANPGENLYKAAKVSGDNTLYIRWVAASGEEGSLEFFTLDNTVAPLNAWFDRVVNSYHDWTLLNPNSVSMICEWSILESGQSGKKWPEPGESQLRIPSPPEGSYTLVLTWKDEFGDTQTAEFEYYEEIAPAASAPEPQAASETDETASPPPPQETADIPKEDDDTEQENADDAGESGGDGNGETSEP